jgi:hypothetical protein
MDARGLDGLSEGYCRQGSGERRAGVDYPFPGTEGQEIRVTTPASPSPWHPPYRVRGMPAQIAADCHALKQVSLCRPTPTILNKPF